MSHLDLRPLALGLVLVLCATTARAGDPPAKQAAGPAPQPAAAPAAQPAPPPPPPVNPKLDAANTLLAKRRYDDALKALNAAAEFPDNTPAMRLSITVSKVIALVHKKKPDRPAARAIVLSILHSDPDATTIRDAADEVQELVREVRESQPLIVHDAVTVAKPDRPIRFRAKVRDPNPSRTVSLTLHYKPHYAEAFSTESFKQDMSGYTAFIRSPESLAPADVTDDFLVDYYITAEDSTGKVLDSNALPESPLSLHVSAAAAKAAEEKAGININLVEHPPLPPPLPPPPPPPTPWYKRWYVVGGAGVVVVGVAVGCIVAATQKPALPHNVGVLTLQ